MSVFRLKACFRISNRVDVMGLWDRQKDWKEIDEETRRRGSKPNRVLPQLRNLKVAPSKRQGFFAKMKSYLKHLLRI